jgi:hypothetical protein
MSASLFDREAGLSSERFLVCDRSHSFSQIFCRTREGLSIIGMLIGTTLAMDSIKVAVFARLRMD